MYVNKLSAIFGAALTFAGAGVGTAFAASGTGVTVRVEGKTKTLLAPTVVHVGSGSLTNFGAPKGACSRSTAAGALDMATHHKWAGSWETKYSEYFVKSILGEAAVGPKYYWNVWVDNTYAQSGICGLKLHKGETILFASAKYPEYPLALQVPSHTSAGSTITGKVVYYTPAGKEKPLAGATVTVNGASGKTGKHGTVPLTPGHAGKYKLYATDPGYIRAAPVTLTVS